MWSICLYTLLSFYEWYNLIKFYFIFFTLYLFERVCMCTRGRACPCVQQGGEGEAGSIPVPWGHDPCQRPTLHWLSCPGGPGGGISWWFPEELRSYKQSSQIRYLDFLRNFQDCSEEGTVHKILPTSKCGLYRPSTSLWYSDPLTVDKLAGRLGFLSFVELSMPLRDLC